MLCYIRIFIRKVEYTMKKLIAILLSVLMLCSVIPFASVAAAEDVTVELVIVDELELMTGSRQRQQPGQTASADLYDENIPF